MRTTSAFLRLGYGFFILFLVICCLTQVSRAQKTTATAVQTMATAIVFNIYWDSNWDADNPDLLRGKIDTATNDIVNSSYLTSLSEYGFQSATFGGSFLPNSKCVQKAPNSPGFFVPSGPGISQFIQCEHDNESALQNSIAIYNVILPESSLESDFWLVGFCGSGVIPSATAWHYHGLPDISIINPTSLTPFSGGPIYTILMTNPACFVGLEQGAFFENLTHEMIEAITDPFPLNISIIPPHADAPFTGEIADICEAGQNVPNAGPILAFADSAGNTPNQPVSVASHWSNVQQTCLGFSDTTMPSFTSPVVQLSNFGPQIVLEVFGSGFGTTNNGVGIGMLTLNDNTDFWQAGNLIDQNSIQFSEIVFEPTRITAVGLTNLSSFQVTSAGTSLTIWVCNPNSLKCQSTAFVTPIPPPPCPGIEARNSAGVCTCPRGTTQTAAGVCTCPTGSEWVAGECFFPNVPNGLGPAPCPANCKFGCNGQTKVCNPLPPPNAQPGR